MSATPTFTIGSNGSITIESNTSEELMSLLKEFLKKFFEGEIKFFTEKGYLDKIESLKVLIGMVENNPMDALVQFVQDKCHVTFGYLGKISEQEALGLYDEVIKIMKNYDSIAFKSSGLGKPTPTCLGLKPYIDDLYNLIKEFVVLDPSYLKFDAEYNEDVSGKLENVMNLNFEELKDLENSAVKLEKFWHVNLFSKDFVNFLIDNQITINVQVTEIFLKEVGYNRPIVAKTTF